MLPKAVLVVVMVALVVTTTLGLLGIQHNTSITKTSK